MRLTLRTMLAYLDEILEPIDRDEIGHKIEESEFATKLVERIRDCIHKTRLGAPKLSGKGMGLDPNTVAEYLDNTLGGERVPDFEKVCLESDTHLAEVAASHQILTMVLGQPVEVDPALKRRVYGIIRGPETARPVEPVGLAAGDRFAPVEDVGIIPSRQRLEVPEYLRARGMQSKWRTIVAAVALVVLLCGAITMALGPLDHTNPVARWLGLGQQPDNQVAQNDAGKNQAAPAATTDKDKNVPAVAPESAPAAESNSIAADTGEKSPAASEMNNSSSAGPTHESTAAASSSNTANAQPPATASIPSAAEAAMSRPQPPATSPVSSAAVPPSPGPPSASPASSMPADTAVTSPVPSDPGRSSPLPPQSEPAPAASPPVPGAQPSEVLLGRLLPGKGIILLKLDPSTGQWNRLASGSPLAAGDKLQVLPTFRPTLALTSGITLQVPSETSLELEAPDASGVPGVKLHFGRLVLMTTGQSGAKLRLDLGASRGLVTFNDAEATLGVEVRRYHMPGADPEAQEPRTAADLYAVSGRVQWTPADGAPTTLTAPQRVVVAAHPGDPASAEGSKLIPKWISAEQLIPLNALAADELVKTISDDKRPLLLELREMAGSRRIECRSLAVQCLALLDQFEPLITALGDPDEHPVWPVQIASVRSASARGPSTAAMVREAFQRQRGDVDGKELDRMLWGYTRDQLQAGDAAKLVGYLNNDNLDFRVLAFADLLEISKPTFNYRPDAPAVSREGPILRWQEQLRKGLLVPREPTPAAPPSTPTAMPAGR